MKRDLERLDRLLVERGLVESAGKAQALILAGKVVVDGHRRDKPGDRVARDADIHLKGIKTWASRGAHKLLGALDAMPELAERIRGAHCLDIGASTGGFTDVMLQHGAASVVALDVGYGQLHWKLQSDDRVTVLDRTNIRHLAPGLLPHAPSFATCDASFISVRRFLDVVHRELAPGGVFVCLVKPQFELPREEVGPGGIVRDPELRQRALEDVRSAAEALGFVCRGSLDSPIAGPKGNLELLLVLERPGLLQGSD
ncbi:MAG: TlyA family rRNA (cytidine-2'-O)-methyltransferase [Deltaproteobacteria bacterium]|nr:TlyA family rRNA (cytidine-2'-O)-methyltransferase [Deltaproteobacteria bacterium]